jgi:hypothetical protein
MAAGSKGTECLLHPPFTSIQVHPSTTFCVVGGTSPHARQNTKRKISVEPVTFATPSSTNTFKTVAMKTILFPFLMALLMFASQSCSRNSDDTNTSIETAAVTSGSWRVSLFTDSGNNETSDFTGYTFQFTSGGTMTAARNGVVKNGTWSINSSSNKYNINLGAKEDNNRPLGELTDDWKIISLSATEIRLSDDNASSNEFLTFTKN